MDEIEKKAEEIRAEIDGAKGEAKEAKTKAESVEVKMTEIETGFSVKTNDLKKEIDQLRLKGRPLLQMSLLLPSFSPKPLLIVL